MDKTFQCLLVSSNETGGYDTTISTKQVIDLPAGDVLIRVHYSSLNYKDALSASGNKGVTRSYPHTPGIDAAGVVEASHSTGWQPGDEVIVTGFDLGMNTSGGFAQYIRAPANWIVRRPESLTLRESMIYGTAGFTAGLSVAALLKNGLTPDHGTVLVTGATGGVGSVAVGILHRLGFAVTAMSGKATAHDFLTSLGATDIIPRSDMDDTSGKALLKSRFAGAIDTVGGNVLATVIKSTEYGGTVTCCGNVNGGDLPLSVFPFILRGVQLVGIDSVQFPIDQRAAVWERLANDWKPAALELMTHEIGLAALPEAIQTILKGQMQGRTLVRID
ncbi:YhdH/YhfP family quinone oxidoreductase [Spirosoma oryzicola]|uniref:YhdH/YhfP family quinone oxidoreductase n=1 Tax=Spirosoma oryzicola TaxID=2898794 RepID=UPI001E3DEE0C|nr:YhdH/YhfP family quinone oxidoreductase [Spirosoma oryzicola]UHG93967.1 YhdH/YhfP family quinone oxidoreductase [Spirosoma oryzicola]